MEMDKTKWPDGPWKSEPDHERWTDEKTGLECLIRRNHFGSLCGYVGITESHPAYGMPYHGSLSASDESPTFNEKEPLKAKLQEKINGIFVHGSLSFSDKWPDEEGSLYWFGFDCAHFCDFSPACSTNSVFGVGSYKDIHFVREQCQLLARQLSEITRAD